MAKSWEASADIGRNTPFSSTSSPMLISSASHSSLPSIRLLTILFLARSAYRLRMSFHITNCEKEKIPIYADSSTSQFFCSMTALRTMVNTLRVSMPCSSSGRTFRPLISMLKSCFSFSRMVTFICGSSSRRRTTYPCAADLRTISTGTRMIGAYLGLVLLGFSYQRSRPNAIYRVFAPFSSSADLAER